MRVEIRSARSMGQKTNVIPGPYGSLVLLQDPHPAQEQEQDGDDDE
jgi:hypothetical protein